MPTSGGRRGGCLGPNVAAEARRRTGPPESPPATDTPFSPLSLYPCRRPLEVWRKEEVRKDRGFPSLVERLQTSGRWWVRVMGGCPKPNIAAAVGTQLPTRQGPAKMRIGHGEIL